MVEKNLIVKNISFSYLIKNSFFKTTKVLALNNVSCEVRNNQKIGFIGSNGSGKSTLAKIIANLISPDEGTIINNFLTTFLLPNVLVFERSLSGLDNIKIFVNLVNNKSDKNHLNELIINISNFSELKDRLLDKVSSYSDGMYTRLAVSILTFLDPELLIIDENLGAGDIDFQKKTINHFRKSIDNKTVIFISHNYDLLSEFCQKSYWINNGKIVDFDDTKIIHKKYKDYLSSKKN